MSWHNLQYPPFIQPSEHPEKETADAAADAEGSPQGLGTVP